MPANDLEEMKNLIKSCEYENMILNVEYNKYGKMNAEVMIKNLHTRIHAYEKYVTLLESKIQIGE